MLLSMAHLKGIAIDNGYAYAALVHLTLPYAIYNNTN